MSENEIRPQPPLDPDASTQDQAGFAGALDLEPPASPASAGILRDVEPATAAAPAATPPATPAATPTPVSGRGRERQGSDGLQPGFAELQFIGTATLLLHLGEFTILTDPNFVHHAREVDLGFGIKTTRLTDPAIEIDDLPRLDLVLVSHLHGDHFDRLAAALLNPAVSMVSNPQAARGLNLMGFRNAQGLDTWRSLDLRKGDTRLRITAMPARHAPRPLDAVLPEVTGWLIDVHSGRERVYRLYISGDTLIHDRLRQIPHRYEGIDLAVLHLGGARLAGVKLSMDGEDGVECLRIVAPRVAVPVHYEDYAIYKSPLSEFREAVDRAGLADRVRYVGRGERLDLADLRATVAGVVDAERVLRRRP